MGAGRGAGGDDDTVEVRGSVQLPRPADEVWARVTTPAGINDELRPWLHMTMPRGAPARLDHLESGDHLGRSWLLLFGVVPFDWDDLGIEAIEPGYFREVSTMATASRWQHERWVEPLVGDPSGCVLHDRVRFVPRRALAAVPGLRRVHEAIITTVFRHRHRRLQRWASGRSRAADGWRSAQREARPTGGPGK
jgi:hypothetical protein